MVSAGTVILSLVGVAAGSYVVYVVVKKQQASAQPGGNPPSMMPPINSMVLVQWDPSKSTSNMEIDSSNPNIVTKNDSLDGWEETGAVSLQQINGSGFVQLLAPKIVAALKNQFPGFTVCLGSIVFGITTQDSIKSLNDIDYAFKLNDDGSLMVLENGSPVLDPSFAPGDTLRIHNNNGQVMYHQNGNVLYTSTKPLTSTWKAACAIMISGQSISGLEMQSM